MNLLRTSTSLLLICIGAAYNNCIPVASGQRVLRKQGNRLDQRRSISVIDDCFSFLFILGVLRMNVEWWWWQMIRRDKCSLLLLNRDSFIIRLQKQFICSALAGWHRENNLIVDIILRIIWVFPTVCCVLLVSQPSFRRALNVLHLAHLLSVHLSLLLWSIHQAIRCLHVHIETPWVFRTQAVCCGRIAPRVTVPKCHLLVCSQNAHQVVCIIGDGLRIVFVSLLGWLIVGSLWLDTLTNAFHALYTVQKSSY